jgi:hypothetical protein
MEQTAWNLSVERYKRMRDNHPEAWRFVEWWIEATRLSSLLEAGGGAGFASTFLSTGTRYFNIDPNMNKEACHQNTIEGDWCSLNKSPYRRMWDGFLSMATIEMCKNPEIFLDGVVDIFPRVACITFYKGFLQTQRMSSTRFNRIPMVILEHTIIGI